MTLSTEIDEQRLAHRVADGDAEAMRLIYSLYADALTAVCSRYVVERDAVRDVLHDAFVKVFSSIRGFSYKGKGSLGAWMRRIVVNEALAYLKRSRRLDVVSLDDAPDVPSGEEPDVERIPPGKIMELVRRLPDGYRTVLNLYVIEGRSHAEIAGMLGIGADTSASQLHRAKRMLARMIKDLDE